MALATLQAQGPSAPPCSPRPTSSGFPTPKTAHFHPWSGASAAAAWDNLSQTPRVPPPQVAVPCGGADAGQQPFNSVPAYLSCTGLTKLLLALLHEEAGIQQVAKTEYLDGTTVPSVALPCAVSAILSSDPLGWVHRTQATSKDSHQCPPHTHTHC